MTIQPISKSSSVLDHIPGPSEGGVDVYEEAALLQCISCGGRVIPVENSTIYNGKLYGNGLGYICENFPKCDSYVGSHNDGRALGIPANKETRNWRINAHAEFDGLWKGKEKSARFKMYQKLAIYLGTEKGKCHIGMFDIETCKKVIEFVNTQREKEGKS